MTNKPTTRELLERLWNERGCQSAHFKAKFVRQGDNLFSVGAHPPDASLTFGKTLKWNDKQYTNLRKRLERAARKAEKNAKNQI